jgi:hypothetical protein
MDAPTHRGIDVPKWTRDFNHPNREEAFSVNLTTVGIDLAKNVLQIHAINAHGKTVLKKQLRRELVVAFFETYQLV